jgi:hypothetical protein
MELQEYQKLASIDCKIDKLILQVYSAELPMKTIKWLTFLSDERLSLRLSEFKKMDIKKKLYLYYTGLSAKSYEYVLDKSAIKDFIENDEEMLPIQHELALKLEIVGFIERTIDVLNKSSFQVKNIIEWEKFQNGG